MNKTQFIGRLTKDVEIGVAKNGLAFGKLSLAVNRDYKDENGERQTDFFDFKIFGKGADILHKFTQKGDLLYVEAQARQNVYEKEDGTKNYTIDFIINNFEFLQQKTKEENNAEQATEQTQENDNLPF